jgi:hypothetical protein
MIDEVNGAVVQGAPDQRRDADDYKQGGLQP